MSFTRERREEGTKRRRHVKMKAETGVMWSQAKEFLKPPEARKDFPLEPWEPVQTC